MMSLEALSFYHETQYLSGGFPFSFISFKGYEAENYHLIRSQENNFLTRPPLEKGINICEVMQKLMAENRDHFNRRERLSAIEYEVHLAERIDKENCECLKVLQNWFNTSCNPEGIYVCLEEYTDSDTRKGKKDWELVGEPSFLVYNGNDLVRYHKEFRKEDLERIFSLMKANINLRPCRGKGAISSIALSNCVTQRRIVFEAVYVSKNVDPVIIPENGEAYYIPQTLALSASLLQKRREMYC